MELHQIRYFLALAETLNFTRAAKTCAVSQPSLTRAISRLESELGGALVYRERNNTRLTELGRLVAPHLTDVLARAADAELEASSFIKLQKADLALGVMGTIAPIQFAGFLGRFTADNPGVALTLFEASPDQLCEHLLQGKLDVALMARPEGFPAPLTASRLYREPFVIACATGHTFALQDQVHFAEMNGQRYFLRANCEFRDVLNEACDEQGATRVHSCRSEREDWILAMVAADLGVCFLPESAAIFPGVVACPLASPAIERHVSLVTVAGRSRSAPVEAVLRAAQTYRWPHSSRGQKYPSAIESIADLPVS